MKLHIKVLIATLIDINYEISVFKLCWIFVHDHYHNRVLAQLDPKKRRFNTKHAQKDSAGAYREVLWSFSILLTVSVRNNTNRRSQ